MELLVGLDLATLVQRFGPLPPERVVGVLRQACRSLAEAHAAGLLHRDIKPHNLLLCRLGLDFDVVKVLDFGLVKSLREGNAELTADGALTGTPAYMPPERVFGDAADERSDIYSLGCVAYWMLTGRPVFTGETMALLVHHAKTAPEPLSKIAGVAIPAQLERLVMSCIEKDPQRRPASALELWQRLGELTLDTPWTPERAEEWWRRELPDLSAARPAGDASGEFSRPTPAS
jgi:serine/threonine-protein kinase